MNGVLNNSDLHYHKHKPNTYADIAASNLLGELTKKISSEAEAKANCGIP